MPKKDDSTQDDSMTDTVTEPAIAEDVVTLKLKENSFLLGEFAPAGTERDYPRAEAERLLRETNLWEPK